MYELQHPFEKPIMSLVTNSSITRKSKWIHTTWCRFLAKQRNSHSYQSLTVDTLKTEKWFCPAINAQVTNYLLLRCSGGTWRRPVVSVPVHRFLGTSASSTGSPCTGDLPHSLDQFRLHGVCGNDICAQSLSIPIRVNKSQWFSVAKSSSKPDGAPTSPFLQEPNHQWHSGLQVGSSNTQRSSPLLVYHHHAHHAAGRQIGKEGKAVRNLVWWKKAAAMILVTSHSNGELEKTFSFRVQLNIKLTFIHIRTIPVTPHDKFRNYFK